MGSRFTAAMFSKILAVSAMGGASAKDQVNVFYETNCPFSQGFIIDEVGAMMSDENCVQNQIKINWVPWGNAQEVGGAILCQHGIDECFGNKLHVCAKDFFGEDDIAMNKFVVCHVTNVRAQSLLAKNPATYASCPMPAGKTADDLSNCANGGPVWEKFRAAGKETRLAQPGHAPWAVWPGQNADNMQGNFVKSLCDHVIAQGITPQCCQTTGRRLQSPLLV